MQSEDREIDVRGEIERLVRPLLQAFDESDLVRLAVDEEEFGLEVVRWNRPRREQPQQAAGREPAAAEAVAPERPIEAVTADVVGIFRNSRPAIAVGERVTESRELGYVEALGIRNPVRAGRAGVISAIFVEDGEPVEYGQPLFGIEKSQ